MRFKMSFTLLRFTYRVISFRIDNNNNNNNNNNKVNHNLKFDQHKLDNREAIMANGKYYERFLYYE